MSGIDLFHSSISLTLLLNIRKWFDVLVIMNHELMNYEGCCIQFEDTGTKQLGLVLMQVVPPWIFNKETSYPELRIFVVFFTHSI
jgi:hypothetical protein